MSIQEDGKTIIIENAPDIPGLRFRGFMGESDYDHILAVIEGSKEADGNEYGTTLESLTNNYTHLKNCDLNTDMICAEIGGEVIAYQRVWWQQEETPHYRIYMTTGIVLPQWRRKGIGAAMLAWGENRLREIAADHPDSEDAGKFFQNWLSDTQADKKAFLESVGYTPDTYDAELLYPDLSNLPEIPPLPEGVKVRPVTPDHYRAIFEADNEAFRDHAGYSPQTEQDYQRWLNHPTIFTPELWQIAWEGDQVVGQVRSFINHKENEEYKRKRGYTEFISTRRPWRRKGIARSLLIRSLYIIRDAGMLEGMLGVHVDNPNGAYQLYTDVGFEQVRLMMIYRKALK